MEIVPPHGDVVDLTLDRHQEGLIGIGSVVRLQLLQSDVPHLDRLGRNKRLHRRRGRGRRGLLGGSVVGVDEEAGDEAVDAEHEGEDGEEGCGGEARVGVDRRHDRRVERHGEGEGGKLRSGSRRGWGEVGDRAWDRRGGWSLE